MWLNCVTGKLQLGEVETKGEKIKTRIKLKVSESVLTNIKEQFICIIDKNYMYVTSK